MIHESMKMSDDRVHLEVFLNSTFILLSISILVVMI